MRNGCVMAGPSKAASVKHSCQGNHLSNTTCVTQVSSKVANNIANNYGDPWHYISSA